MWTSAPDRHATREPPSAGRPGSGNGASAGLRTRIPVPSGTCPGEDVARSRRVDAWAEVRRRACSAGGERGHDEREGERVRATRAAEQGGPLRHRSQWL